MTTTLPSTPTSVDALDVDAPAAAQLDIDAQRAGLHDHMRIVRPNGGPTSIRFDSRADYEAWADYGLIHVDPNPYHIVVQRTEVHVPVTFGHPYAWNAVAIYPTQDACTCAAELVHMAGCALAVDVVVVEVSR